MFLCVHKILFAFVFDLFYYFVALDWRPWEEFQWAGNKPTSEQTGKVSGKISKEKMSWETWTWEGERS